MYELIACVRQANENAGNLISVVQFLIKPLSLFHNPAVVINFSGH